ncbi:MAG TPA: hypothetical protein VK324_02840 [Tepidisphaeraceae bacterium]|nr:hypothetical protein [Tepidisphaeraceae bacterium]
MGHDGNSELTFKIAAPAYNPAHLTTALFHAAYLNLFRHFGYEYILYCDTEWIRALLTAQRPRADIKICTLEVPREEGAELAAVAHSVGMLQTTAGLRTLVVALPHPDPKFVLRIISLPGFGQEGLAQYRALTERIDHYAQSQFVFLRDDPKGRLGHRCGMLGRSFWQRAFNPHDG